MTMMGVVLSIVLSGGVALFIAHAFFRANIGRGLAVMFFLPVLSCATYIYMTAPYFNPPPPASIPMEAPIANLSMDQIKGPERPATLADIAAAMKVVNENPDDIDAVLGLAGAMMGREDYDATITLLEGKTSLFPEDKDIALQLSSAYFAKGLLRAEQASYAKALDLLIIAHDIAPTQAPFLADLQSFITMIEKQIGSNDHDKKAF